MSTIGEVSPALLRRSSQQPGAVQLGDDRPRGAAAQLYVSVRGTRVVTDGQFRSEAALRAAAVERGAAALTGVQATTIVESYASPG
jgi:hypothetical protein